MLKKILIAFVSIVALFLVIVAFQPSHYQVQRTTTIAAPPTTVFDQVNNFHHWQAWSPWAKMDPAAKNTFEGPASGTGAAFAWAGNSQVGEGRMTMTESRPSELILIKLDFIKPFPSTALTEFTFKPQGNQTAVSWSMSGEQAFLGKAICMFMSMDKMVGGDFEKGLAHMKLVAEAAGKN